MVSQNLQKAILDVGTLNLDERQQLRAMLEGKQPTSIAGTPEDQAEASLLAKGIIARVASPPTAEDIARHQSIQRVEVDGKAVSESLIEDRR